MPRYFFEVTYKGTDYAGFQIQPNADTIQSEMEKALAILCRNSISLTGSSRTDSGVHALQNYFQADLDFLILPKQLYNLNAILPPGICIKNIIEVPADLHCRFNALSRSYQYFIYHSKNPFYNDRAWFYPYPVSLDLLNAAAQLLFSYTDYTAFSKRNTQVHTKQCKIYESHWKYDNDLIVYNVKGNRFLRGMVRGLVSTQLQVGRGKITLDDFQKIIEGLDPKQVDFTAPAHGLFLKAVDFDWPSITHSYL